MTQEGLKHIELLFDIKLRGTKNTPTYAKSLSSRKKKRAAREGEVYGYLAGAGVHILQREKPTLDDLLSVMSTFPSSRAAARTTATPTEDPWVAERPVIHSEADVVPLLRNGIFYSSSEVKGCIRRKQFIRPRPDSEDAIRMSRFIGVVLMEASVYVIFNTRDNLMAWYDTKEKVTEETIRMLFGKCRRYERHNTYNYEGMLPAIVFGETMAMLPALVTGHKGGVDKSVKHKNFDTTYKQLNSKINAYWEMYFVPTERIGREILRATLTRSPSEKFDAEHNFLKQFGSEIYIVKSERRHYGRSRDYIHLIYLPFFHILFLRKAREIGNILVATYPEAINMVSKALGIALGGAMGLQKGEDGNYRKLQFKMYGMDGRELDE